MNNRDGFGSRFGALVAMAGSAVGLGNLWRFPYLVGENGGAAFIIVYILLCFLICLPIFISEFVIGRRSQENAYAAYRDLSGGSAWRWVGLITVIIPIIVASYYSVIGGWSVEYLFKSLTFSFTGDSQVEINTMFTDFVSSPWAPLICHTIFLLMTAVIVMFGIKGGIEKFSKVMMPMLFFIVIGIAVYSVTLPGAESGLSYLFSPDFSKIDGKVCAAALGQAFFSLSLGFGTILTYGSYVSKKENIMYVCYDCRNSYHAGSICLRSESSIRSGTRVRDSSICILTDAGRRVYSNPFLCCADRGCSYIFNIHVRGCNSLSHRREEYVPCRCMFFDIRNLLGIRCFLLSLIRSDVGYPYLRSYHLRFL